MDIVSSSKRGFHYKYTLLKTRQSQGVSIFLRQLSGQSEIAVTEVIVLLYTLKIQIL